MSEPAQRQLLFQPGLNTGSHDDLAVTQPHQRVPSPTLFYAPRTRSRSGSSDSDSGDDLILLHRSRRGSSSFSSAQGPFIPPTGPAVHPASSPTASVFLQQQRQRAALSNLNLTEADPAGASISSYLPERPHLRASLGHSYAVPQAGPVWTESSAPRRQQSPSNAPELDHIHRGPWFEIHRSFAWYVLRTIRSSDGSSPSKEIAELSKQWADWDVLNSLANYRSIVEIFFSYLKDSPNLCRGFAMDVSNRLYQDMHCVLEQMHSILSDRVTYKHFLNCRGIVAQQLLDLLQDLLDSFESVRCRPLLSKALLRLSGECGLHPTCFTLSGLEQVGQQVAGGGFGDIWKGLVGGQTVAVKSMRQFLDNDVRASLKCLGREAIIWRQLSHPNLLPFFGLYVLHGRLSLISPWMNNGDLKHFINTAPSDIDRVSLIADVATGLEYLHGKRIVHGDLKAANILVTPSGRACIADFGLSSIVDELSLKLTFSTSIRAGTARYQAPELLSNERSNHFGSDVYAFGCVCYEILTGKVPFFEVSNEVAVILMVIQGVRPSRLEEKISPENLWLLIDHCWHPIPDNRPTITAILRRLIDQPIRAKIKQSPPDWDDTYNARFRRSIQEWPLFPSIAEIERRIPCSDTALEMMLPWLGTLDLVGYDWASPFKPDPDTNQAETAPIPHDEAISLSAYSTEAISPTRIRSPTGPVVGEQEPDNPPTHRLNANYAPSLTFHFDLAPALFAPLREVPLPPRILGVDELGSQSAFDPPLTALWILHPRIPFWSVEVTPLAGLDSLAISLRDVLLSLHGAMHERVTHEEWAMLNAEEQVAVLESFVARSHAEALRSGVTLDQLYDQRLEGVKRVDYLLGKTVFKELVWAPGDPPGWMLLVTA